MRFGFLVERLNDVVMDEVMSSLVVVAMRVHLGCLVVMQCPAMAGVSRLCMTLQRWEAANPHTRILSISLCIFSSLDPILDIILSKYSARLCKDSGLRRRNPSV